MAQSKRLPVPGVEAEPNLPNQRLAPAPSSMSIPNVIEIVPLREPVQAEVVVPGSKSITNRALILAALARGQVQLTGALWSEDTQVMIDCLQRLGLQVRVEPDPEEPCNRTITVEGCGSEIPPGGTREKPLELFVGNAGTAARFLTALVALGRGVYRLHGVPRMHERPQAALFEALRQLGYKIESSTDRLPALVHGGGRRPGLCWVSIAESSQFASALLLAASRGGWEVEIAGENEEESPYVQMTSKVIQAFPHTGGTFPIEPDASSGSYFWAAGHQEIEDWTERPAPDSDPRQSWRLSRPSVRVAHWPTSGWQIDQHFPDVFAKVRFGSDAFERESRDLAPEHRGKWKRHIEKLLARAADMERGRGALGPAGASKPIPPGRSISRRTDLGDSIMTAVVMAPLGILPVQFTDLGRLRLQECERVFALKTELAKCGASVLEEGDTLTVWPSPKVHGAEIDTYQDHRMAMSFAILGLKVPGVKINNPACVKKTFPNFFQKLAAPPPRGLGATLRDPASGREVGIEELFAD